MQVTISLLEQAMNESGHRRFLIDGFPRNEENRASFEKQVSAMSRSEGHLTSLSALGLIDVNRGSGDSDGRGAILHPFLRLS